MKAGGKHTSGRFTQYQATHVNRLDFTFNKKILYFFLNKKHNTKTRNEESRTCLLVFFDAVATVVKLCESCRQFVHVITNRMQ